MNSVIQLLFANKVRETSELCDLSSPDKAVVRQLTFSPFQPPSTPFHTFPHLSMPYHTTRHTTPRTHGTHARTHARTQAFRAAVLATDFERLEREENNRRDTADAAVAVEAAAAATATTTGTTENENADGAVGEGAPPPKKQEPPAADSSATAATTAAEFSLEAHERRLFDESLVMLRNLQAVFVCMQDSDRASISPHSFVESFRDDGE